MKHLYLVAAAATALIAAPATAATTFKVDTSKTFVNITNNPSACLGCAVTRTLATFTSFDLNVGQSKTFDFATFRVGGLGFGSADIDAQLAFSNPFASIADADASTTYFRGLFTTTGSLIWDNPLQTMTAADGTKFSVQFNNLSGLAFGNTVTSRVTVSLLAAAVPEPATWAMMLVGFGMVAGAARYRRRSSNVSFA